MFISQVSVKRPHFASGISFFDSGNSVMVEGRIPDLVFQTEFLDHSNELFFNAFIFKIAGFELDIGNQLGGFSAR